VEAVPGPSAVLAALSVAGLGVGRFAFEGFLPRAGGDRARALSRIAGSDIAIVLFESPHRIRATLDDLSRVLGAERQIALCRELTKMHEQTIRGTVREVKSALSEPVRGEITVVIEGQSADARIEDVDLEALVSEWQSAGLSTKEMSHRLQRDLGWKRNVAYQAVLKVLTRESHQRAEVGSVMQTRRLPAVPASAQIRPPCASITLRATATSKPRASERDSGFSSRSTMVSVSEDESLSVAIKSNWTKPFPAWSRRGGATRMTISVPDERMTKTARLTRE